MIPRLRRSVLLAAVAATLAPAAHGTAYVWNGGPYSTSGLPLALLAGDTLGVSNSSVLGQPVLDRSLSSAGAISVTSASFYGSGVTLDNAGSFALGVDGNVLALQSAWTFTNEAGATLSKSGGTGTSLFNSGVSFSNNGGTVQAVTGTLQFGGSSNTFNAGSTFAGAGTILVTGNSRFNDSLVVQSGASLVLSGGTFTGAASGGQSSGASIRGTLNFQGGLMNGNWTLAQGAVLNAAASVAGGNPQLSGVFANNGTVNLAGAFYGNALAFGNNAGGVFGVTAGSTLSANQNPWTFTNSGVLQQLSGSGTTTWNSGVTFVNNGVPINIASGTMQWAGNSNTFNGGTTFTGGGTALVTGSAAFNDNVAVSSGTTLALRGGTYTGGSATAGGSALLTGTAGFQGGLLNGHWTVGPKGVLNVVASTVGGNPQVAGTLDNYGTVNLASTFFGNGLGFNNHAGGTVSLAGNNSLSANQNPWTFNNAGLLLKSGSTGTTTIGAGVSLNNLTTGNIRVDNGVLALTAGSFSNQGTLTFGIDGPSATGVIDVGTSTALGGSFAAVLNGYTPTVGQVFDVMNFTGGYSGRFTNGSFTAGGFVFDGVYTPGSFELVVAGVAAVPEPSTWMMLATGGLVMGGAAVRRRSSVRPG